VIEVSANNNTQTSGTTPGCTDSQPTINVCLRRETHRRLSAYKNYNPLSNKTFDEAVNEILDTVEFPEADAFENIAFPTMSYTGDQEFPSPNEK